MSIRQGVSITATWPQLSVSMLGSVVWASHGGDGAGRAV